MTQAEIAGTEVIAKYMGIPLLGGKVNNTVRTIVPASPFTTAAVYTESQSFNYHKSLDALAPVVKKVQIELVSFAKYEWELWSAASQHCLNINSACMDMEADAIFTSLVAAINFINDKRKEDE